MHPLSVGEINCGKCYTRLSESSERHKCATRVLLLHGSVCVYHDEIIWWVLGVNASTDFAKDCGIETTKNGSIIVDKVCFF